MPVPTHGAIARRAAAPTATREGRAPERPRVWPPSRACERRYPLSVRLLIPVVASATLWAGIIALWRWAAP